MERPFGTGRLPQLGDFRTKRLLSTYFFLRWSSKCGAAHSFKKRYGRVDVSFLVEEFFQVTDSSIPKQAIFGDDMFCQKSDMVKSYRSRCSWAPESHPNFLIFSLLEIGGFSQISPRKLGFDPSFPGLFAGHIDVWILKEAAQAWQNLMFSFGGRPMDPFLNGDLFEHIWAMKKKPWLFRLYRGLYYPV